MASRRVVSVLSRHAACRHGLAALVARKGITVVECATLAQLSASARRAHAFVVDLDHLEQDGATLFAAARALGHAVPVGTAIRQAASITTLADVGIESRTLDAQAFASLTDRRHAPAELARQFRLWQRITPRQRSVMRLLAAGSDNRTIARALGVGERAVKAHVSALLALFGLDNRTELALLAYEAGLR
ncbi:MAG: LuxR C-terminal-related transcriptional regulator [Kofleriaceae bacterium]